MSENGDRICENILEAVGNTPLIYLTRVTKGCYAKVGEF